SVWEREENRTRRSAERLLAVCWSPPLARFFSCRSSTASFTGTSSELYRRKTPRCSHDPVGCSQTCTTEDREAAMDSEEPTTSPSGPDEPQSRPAESPRDGGGERRPKRRFKLAILAVIGLLFFGALLVVGILPRLNRQKKIMEASQAIKDAIPSVSVIIAERAPAASELELPGNIEAIQTTPISARTNGY